MLFIYIDESRSRSAKIGKLFGLNWRDPSNKSNPSLRLLMLGRLSPGLRCCDVEEVKGEDDATNRS